MQDEQPPIPDNPDPDLMQRNPLIDNFGDRAPQRKDADSESIRRDMLVREVTSVLIATRSSGGRAYGTKLSASSS